MRARIHYAGRDYFVTGRDVEAVQEQIEHGLRSGDPLWLPVHFGEGRPSDTVLLITSGTSIAIVADSDAANGPGDDAESDAERSSRPAAGVEMFVDLGSNDPFGELSDM